MSKIISVGVFDMWNSHHWLICVSAYCLGFRIPGQLYSLDFIPKNRSLNIRHDCLEMTPNLYSEQCVSIICIINSGSLAPCHSIKWVFGVSFKLHI